MKSYYTTAILVCFLFKLASGQVEVLNHPIDLQLIPRNPGTNTAFIEVEGHAHKFKAKNWEAVHVRIWQDNQLIRHEIRPLDFSEADTIHWKASVEVHAGMHQYHVETHAVRGKKWKYLSGAKNVVVGDVIIIHGQSNAETYEGSKEASENKNDFIRVYGCGREDYQFARRWNIAEPVGNRWNEGGAGLWGLKLAKMLVDSFQMPIAIFNGAHGGQFLEFFQRGDREDVGTNYGRLWRRVQESRASDRIRAIFWFQGENDAGSALGTEYYRLAFEKLSQSWHQDFPGLERIYVMQIRQGCGCSTEGTLGIQEGQRRLPGMMSDVQVMSSSGVERHSDDCHYNYKDGYEVFADRLYPLAAHDLYGAPVVPGMYAPDLDKVQYIAPNQLIVTIRQTEDTLTWDEGAEADFRLESAPGVSIVSGRAEGNRLVFTLSGPLPETAHFSYAGRSAGTKPCIRNQRGVPMLNFYYIRIAF